MFNIIWCVWKVIFEDVDYELELVVINLKYFCSIIYFKIRRGDIFGRL